MSNFDVERRQHLTITTMRLLWCIFGILYTALCAVDPGINMKLLQCFDYKRNYWLVGYAFHTSSVQFKDECLRLCLAALIRGKRCLSAMHIPGDDQCVISDQDQLTRPDLFVENDAHHTFTVNYFRNTCIDPPVKEGGRLEARLNGFRGGEGILELAQRKGQNPKLLAIMTGLEENKNFHLIYAPDVELSSCYKAGLMKDKQGKKLITVDSDSRGMAIQPWTEIDFHILDDAIIDKVILVVEAGTSNVVDCGKLQIHGNVSDWQRAMNGSPTSFPITVPHFVAILIALLTFV